MEKTTSHNHWLKKAIIYSLDVRSFKDGNQDGLGDLKGLLAKFDYFKELGITCLWFLPFYSSDNKDGGYDVVDYCQIDPRFGTMHDFEVFVDKAKSNGIRIILDLVVNHTSKDHPWFQDALKNPDSIYHRYYIWSKQKPKKDAEDVVFKEVEDSNWEYENQVGLFYYHTFYKHQPDLNIANPVVQKEILTIMEFWLKKGISGFRIDAAPHILHHKGKERFEGDPYNILNQWRNTVLKINEEAVLIGEADVEPEKYPQFFNKGRRLTGIFNFFINNYTFFAFAKRDPQALIKAYERLPLSAAYHQYLNFMRNHDELDLERLKEEERAQVFEAFAPKPDMVVYGRGIRRRFPPMVKNDHRRIKLSMSLLLTLPGTPIIRYGEEIGMGDDLRLPERESVRTTMQWSASVNGGFSAVSEKNMQYTTIKKGTYGYPNINVSKQQAEVSSLWHNVVRMIAVRKQQTPFHSGTFSVIASRPKQILAFIYRQAKQACLIVHNFHKESVKAVIDLDKIRLQNVQFLLGTEQDFSVDGKKLNINLNAYGYVWFAITLISS